MWTTVVCMEVPVLVERDSSASVVTHAAELSSEICGSRGVLLLGSLYRHTFSMRLMIDLREKRYGMVPVNVGTKQTRSDTTYVMLAECNSVPLRRPFR